MFLLVVLEGNQKDTKRKPTGNQKEIKRKPTKGTFVGVPRKEDTPWLSWEAKDCSFHSLGRTFSGLVAFSWNPPPQPKAPRKTHIHIRHAYTFHVAFFAWHPVLSKLKLVLQGSSHRVWTPTALLLSPCQAMLLDWLEDWLAPCCMTGPCFNCNPGRAPQPGSRFLEYDFHLLKHIFFS